MKTFAFIMLMSSLLLAKEPSQDLLTQYYSRNTLSEVILENVYYDNLQTSFELNEHASFFSDLEEISSGSEPKKLKGNYSHIDAEKIEASLKKLHLYIQAFCKKHSSTTISSLLKEWSSFHFSKQEKETLYYFQELTEPSVDHHLSSLEQHLQSILLYHDLMKRTFQEHKEKYSLFYFEHGNYLLDLYTHKKMLHLLDHDFQPAVFHHIETYLKIAKKNASFFHNTNLLHHMIQGDIALSNESEIAAKRLLKPHLKKIDAYFEEID